jgi:hypothetical protein
MRTNPYLGSHLPVLMKLIGMTEGPILELGSGPYSTQYLHWACAPTKRPLVTYETNPEWWTFTKDFQDDFHTTSLVSDWSTVTFDQPWSIAFVDHDGVRSETVQRLRHAEYVVCHDTENRGARRWGLLPVHRWFQWQWRYDAYRPCTTVFSNTHDLTGFSIP